jgi:hypothetical protein
MHGLTVFRPGPHRVGIPTYKASLSAEKGLPFWNMDFYPTSATPAENPLHTADVIDPAPTRQNRRTFSPDRSSCCRGPSSLNSAQAQPNCRSDTSEFQTLVK